MHYCIAIITEQFPTNDVLSEKLNPFSEERFYDEHESRRISQEDYPQFMWDWWQVGGRYCGLLKLKVDMEDEEYRWQFYADKPRAGRQYRSQMLEKHFAKMDSDGRRSLIYAEEDVYGYLGFHDGYIRVDGCKVKDVIDFEETVVKHGWGFIGKDGTAYSRSHWNGDNFIDDEQYENKVKDAIANVDDCYVCYVDIHD